MDILSWDGTISSAEFRVAACSLMEKWKSISSNFLPWSWIACPKQPRVVSHEVSAVNRVVNLSLVFKKLMLLSLFVPLSISLSGGRILVPGEHNSQVQ